MRASVRKSGSQLSITARHKEKQQNGVECIFGRTGVLPDPAACAAAAATLNKYGTHPQHQSKSLSFEAGLFLPEL